MARPLRSNPRFDPMMLASYQPQERDMTRPVSAFALTGMNRTLPLPSMAHGVSRLVRNLGVRLGSYKTRDGTSVVGAQSGANLLYAVDVALRTGANQLTRFRTNGIDVFDGTNWAVVPGSTFTGLETEPFAITGWGEDVIFTAGSGKLWQLDFSPLGVAEITGAPTGVRHLTTFGNRVVASMNNNTIQWAVKNNSTDWAGLGSGYEDLQSSPGGRPDQQTAVVPITDELAYAVRTNSIWQMTQTGDFDAPFAFSRLFTFVGSRYPQTVVPIARGLICLGDAQVWMVTPQGERDIGEAVRDYLNVDLAYLKKATATYDALFGEYRLMIPSAASLTAERVLRYRVADDAWTEDVYPFPIKSAAFTMFTNASGTGTQRGGSVYAMEGTSRWVAKDDETKNDNATRDVNPAGLGAASGFRIESGDIRIADDSERKEVVDLVLWYESTLPVTLGFDYSYDGGTTWVLMSTVIAPATTRPTPLKVQRTIDRDFFQFAVSTEATPTVKLIRLEVWMREAGRIVDA